MEVPDEALVALAVSLRLAPAVPMVMPLNVASPAALVTVLAGEGEVMLPEERLRVTVGSPEEYETWLPKASSTWTVTVDDIGTVGDVSVGWATNTSWSLVVAAAITVATVEVAVVIERELSVAVKV